MHKAFQIDNLKYLSDIYIPEEEMFKYRDTRRAELKDFEKQTEVFENYLNSMDSSKFTSIDVDKVELEHINAIQSKFQELQEEFVLTWSIISTMSEDIKRFHTNLRVMESIHSTSDDKYEAKMFLSDFRRHEDRIESQKQLKPQMGDHHHKIDNFMEDCKIIQVENAKKIIQMVKNLSLKSSDSIAAKSQKLQTN